MQPMNTPLFHSSLTASLVLMSVLAGCAADAPGDLRSTNALHGVEEAAAIMAPAWQPTPETDEKWRELSTVFGLRTNPGLVTLTLPESESVVALGLFSNTTVNNTFVVASAYAFPDGQTATTWVDKERPCEISNTLAVLMPRSTVVLLIQAIDGDHPAGLDKAHAASIC